MSIGSRKIAGDATIEVTNSPNNIKLKIPEANALELALAILHTYHHLNDDEAFVNVTIKGNVRLDGG